MKQFDIRPVCACKSYVVYVLRRMPVCMFLCVPVFKSSSSLLLLCLFIIVVFLLLLLFSRFVFLLGKVFIRLKIHVIGRSPVSQ